ncbi:Homeobox-containing protein 1 [Ilyodon furcidens]|uniref:Homeobox-containing protein 1 n=1 Tax=Ilyodon furcidens TaxID=33524 RepID=A0ABV0UXG1_9TELE
MYAGFNVCEGGDLVCNQKAGRDSSLVKEEIKAFLGNRRISQAVVAQVTGISQSRISHWLLQHGSDLSEQKKRAFYRWYILEKTTPGT